MDKTLIDRLEDAGNSAPIKWLDYRPLILEAAAALRATTGEGECCHSYPCQRPGSVRGACTMEAPTPAEPECPKCGGTGEVCTGTIDGIPELFDCPDCAAPTPAATINPPEIDSKLIGPLRDAGAVAWCDLSNPLNSEAFAWPGTAREARHSTPLYAHPAPQQPAITDAVVERACRGFYGARWNRLGDGGQASAREWMRAALAAAKEVGE